MTASAPLCRPFWKISAMSGSPCWVGTSTTTICGIPAQPLSCAALMCRGYEVKNVRFKDVVLEDNNGPAQSIQMQNCQNVSLENITVQAGTQPE